MPPLPYLRILWDGLQSTTARPHFSDWPAVTLPQAVKTCLLKYAVFSGRAARPEYWWWVLAVAVASFAFSFIDSFIGFLVSPGGPYATWGFLQPVFAIAVLLPSISVTVRRLHDIGKTGWWALLWYGIIAFGWATFAVAVGIVLLAVLGASGGHLGLAEIIDLSLIPMTPRVRPLSPDGNVGFGVTPWFFLFALFTLLAGILTAFAATIGVLIWSILWLARQGHPGPNRYGPDPNAPDTLA